MGLVSPWQRVVVFGLVVSLLAVVAIVFGAVIASLSDQNARDVGHWFDENKDELWKGLVVVAPAVATYLFGRRAGRHVAKREAYNSAIATVRDKPTADEAAEALRDEARGHGIQVTT